MIIRADARSIPLRDGCVQTVVTSPPYWGLRDYGIAGQIGLQPTPDEYLATMVAVFREVKRVLRDDGTVWCNLGDSYANDTKWGGSSGGKNYTSAGGGYHGQRDRRDTGLKPKDLCGMPWKVAFALQADGWYLRSDIIWAKPNPMPESVTDRPTRSHEYLFLLAKQERYFFDADAIREPASELTNSRGPAYHAMNKTAQPGNGIRQNSSWESATWGRVEARNKRDVWTVNSEPTPEAHFATFPQALITPCILAGTSEKGACVECGAPWVRVTERGEIERLRGNSTAGPKAARGDGFGRLANGYSRSGWTPGIRPVATLGWRPSCSHDAPIVPCLVLDPFLGSGTVGKVCERLGRRWAGLELSAEYIGIARRRTAQRGLFNFGGGNEAERGNRHDGEV